MRSEFIALFLILSGCASETPVVRSIPLNQEVEKFVAISAPNRSVNESGHEKAFEYLKSRFDEIAKQNLHAKVSVQEFLPDVEFAAANYQKDFDTAIKPKFKPNDPNYKKWDTFTKRSIAFVRQYKNIKGKNLILELPGTSQNAGIIYIGAHYDTITHNHDTLEFTPKENAPGADDNVSGVVVLLNLAEHFARTPHMNTLRFVAFDYEEIFFLGSYAMAKEISKEKILGLINLEMVGWSQKKNTVKIYTRVGNKDDLAIAVGLEKAALENKLNITPVILQNDFNRSDNWSFWQKNIPAVCVSEDWEDDFNEKNYHTPHDLPGTLNYDYMGQLAKMIQASISMQ